MLIGIAWRNIWRSRKRSMIMLSAIAIGLSAGLVATGIMIGMADSMVNTAIDRYLGHVEIHTPSFKSDPSVNDFIRDGDGIAKVVSALHGVKGVSGRTIVEGMAASPATNSGVKIVGMDPEAEESVTTIFRQMITGTYLGSSDRNAAIVGAKLAEKLKLRLHSRLVLSFPGRDGSIIYGSFAIIGIFRTESTLFDKSTVFVRRSDLGELLGDTALVHEIAVRFESVELMPGDMNFLRTRYHVLAVDSWKDLAPELKLTSETTNVSMLFFLGIILFGLLFGITNTMLMSVLDRVREFGVLMAIGMKRKRIFLLVVLETLFLSILGGVFGTGLGAVAIAITRSTGINLSLVAEGLSSYGISSMLYPSIPSVLYLDLGVLVIVTAVFAAIYPAIKATQLEPAVSIRTYA